MANLIAKLPLAQQATETSDTVWRLQTDWPWAPWFTVLFVIAAVALVVFVYARESSPAGAAYRVLLAALRLTAITLVLVMLSELLFSATKSGLPRLALLLDHSASMGLEDTDDGATTGELRLDQVRDFLVASDAKLLDEWCRDYVIEMSAVADGVTTVEGVTAEELAESLGKVDTTSPASNRSRLGDALTATLDAGCGAPPAAIVIATDGRTTAGRSLDEARELARRRGVPVYVLGIGSTDRPADLSLSNLVADDVAVLGDLLAIGVTVGSENMAGESAKVIVRDTASGEVCAEQSITITAAAQNQTIQLLVKAEQPGDTTYEIEVLPLPGERDTENNRVRHAVQVRDQQVSVLLAAGYPNYEFRYLKNLLDRDSTFELASYLQEADIDYAAQDASAIPQLPLNKEAVDKFDVIVLMDLNPRLLPPTWWRNVEQHVVDRRGGLVLVAGPRYFPAQYGSSGPLAAIAPIQLGGGGNIGGQVDDGYQLQLTPLGMQTAAMQLGTSPAESSPIWRGLPPLYWYAVPGQLKPAAQILAVHPTARLAGGKTTSACGHAVRRRWPSALPRV